MQVIASIPIDDVLKAIAAEKTHSPPPSPPPTPAPTPTPIPPPSSPTCNAERDPDQPPSQGLTGMIISGSGFLPLEIVLILADGQEQGRNNADGQGQYRVRLTFPEAVDAVTHTVHAQGLTSRRISPDTSFNI
jgi:hypothetical protein